MFYSVDAEKVCEIIDAMTDDVKQGTKACSFAYPDDKIESFFPSLSCRTIDINGTTYKMWMRVTMEKQ